MFLKQVNSIEEKFINTCAIPKKMAGLGWILASVRKPNGSSLTVTGKELSPEEFLSGYSFLESSSAVLRQAEITILSPSKRRYVATFHAGNYARNTEWNYDFYCSSAESRLTELCKIFSQIAEQVPLVEGRLSEIKGGGMGVRSVLEESLTASNVRGLLGKLKPDVGYVKVNFILTGVPAAYEDFLPEGFTMRR